jgi:hypothetical protein
VARTLGNPPGSHYLQLGRPTHGVSIAGDFLLSKSGPDGAAASLEHAVQCVRLQLQMRCPPSAPLIYFPGIRFQPSRFELPAPPRYPSFCLEAFMGKPFRGGLFPAVLLAVRLAVCFAFAIGKSPSPHRRPPPSGYDLWRTTVSR